MRRIYRHLGGRVTKPRQWRGPQQPTALFDVAPAYESEYEDTIVDAAAKLGYLVHVERKARTKEGFRTAIKGHVGWPDVVIVGHGRAWFIELKRRPKQPTEAQLVWIAALNAAGCQAAVRYVPEDLEAILEDLTQWRESALKLKEHPHD